MHKQDRWVQQRDWTKASDVSASAPKQHFYVQVAKTFRGLQKLCTEEVWVDALDFNKGDGSFQPKVSNALKKKKRSHDCS